MKTFEPPPPLDLPVSTIILTGNVWALKGTTPFTGLAMDRYTLLPWFLNFVFVIQKFVIYGCRKQAISNQDPAWIIHITLQYRNNILGSTKVTLSQL